MGKSRQGRCREGPESLRDLRVAEVTEQDIQLKDGKVVLHRVKVKVSFKYEASEENYSSCLDSLDANSVEPTRPEWVRAEGGSCFDDALDKFMQRPVLHGRG
jgi:hypothetical protein